MLLSVNRCEDTSMKRLIFHETEDAVLLDSGSSTSDLCVDCLPCEILWCSVMSIWEKGAGLPPNLVQTDVKAEISKILEYY